jgi:carboxylesterase type B
VAPSVLLAERLHCGASDVTCFRSRSADQIVAAQAAVNNMLTSLNILSFFEPWLPVIDNVIVHSQLLDMVHNISFPLKPLIIGTVTDECLDFVYGTWNKTISPLEYVGVITVLFPKKAFKVLEHYPPEGEGDQRSLIARVATHWVFACSTRAFARKAASYSYVYGYPFDKETSSKNSITCPNHACHGDELPFTFESYWDSFTDTGRRVSQGMATYWTNFGKSQDPNEPSRVPVLWPRVTTGNETYMYIQNPFQIGQNYLKSDCDFWDKIGYKNDLF